MSCAEHASVKHLIEKLISGISKENHTLPYRSLQGERGPEHREVFGSEKWNKEKGTLSAASFA